MEKVSTSMTSSPINRLASSPINGVTSLIERQYRSTRYINIHGSNPTLIWWGTLINVDLTNFDVTNHGASLIVEAPLSSESLIW